MGFDKAFLRQNNESLLLHNAIMLQEIFEKVVLVSNMREKLNVIEGIEQFLVLTDLMPDCGPLGGICTALSKCDTPYIFVLACDMPSPSSNLIYKMYEQLEGNQVVLCSHDGEVETLFTFYHRSCLPVFKKQINENHLKIRQEFSKLNIKCIPLTDQESGDAFENINTPKDLQRWEMTQSDTFNSGGTYE